MKNDNFQSKTTRRNVKVAPKGPCGQPEVKAGGDAGLSVTLAFSIHRPEILPLAADLMAAHDAIFLEEPPTRGFAAMLRGELAVAEYLMESETEYPEFGRRTCDLLQALSRRGIPIFQVEPFLEALVGIHDFFADGGRPSELSPGSVASRVYAAEKAATAALLVYYRTVMTGSFEAALATVKAFAAVDAARFRLRDDLRAEALASGMAGYARVYIEAGEIHHGLWGALRTALAGRGRLRVRYLSAPVVRRLTGRGRLAGPGDCLTLRYLYHPASRDPRLDLLAARSLVYNKLLTKEEMPAGIGEFPHTRDEVATIQVVQRLSLKDCQALFPVIRRLGTAAARELVRTHLQRGGDRRWPSIWRIAGGRP